MPQRRQVALRTPRVSWILPLPEVLLADAHESFCATNRYVWEAGKIECRQRLLDYYAEHDQQKKRSSMPKQARNLTRRSRRRSADSPATHDSMKRHSDLLAKRASSQTYCIIALDHLTDMTTRAVAGKTIPSFGGYLSVEMTDWNKDDDLQHWRITPA